jgi:hypothetical protein
LLFEWRSFLLFPAECEESLAGGAVMNGGIGHVGNFLLPG